MMIMAGRSDGLQGTPLSRSMPLRTGPNHTALPRATGVGNLIVISRRAPGQHPDHPGTHIGREVLSCI
jgi:hypothetical protein